MMITCFKRVSFFVKTLSLIVLPLAYLFVPLSQANETSTDHVSFQPDPLNAPVVFVSSSCTICSLDQPMRVGFSADQDGIMTVLLITPDGQQSTLLSQAVESNTLQYVNAIATAPVGKHALIALFGEGQGDLAKTLAQLIPEPEKSVTASSNATAEQKGLELMPQPIQLIPHAIREFEIVE